MLAGATAASVTFKVGGNDVSELIAAAPGTAAASALAGRLPASCARYKATVDGKTVTYSVTESALSGIGKQAKVLNVASAAGGSDARWSLVYRGAGFVGAVTVAGPNASADRGPPAGPAGLRVRGQVTVLELRRRRGQ